MVQISTCVIESYIYSENKIQVPYFYVLIFIKKSCILMYFNVLYFINFIQCGILLNFIFI